MFRNGEKTDHQVKDNETRYIDNIRGNNNRSEPCSSVFFVIHNNKIRSVALIDGKITRKLLGSIYIPSIG